MAVLPSGALRFRPTGQHDLAPSGEVERIRANLDAVRALTRQHQQQRPATADEQVLYARWSGWGATPALFDERPRYAGRFAAERAELRAVLGDDGYRAAQATTLNAHYTDAAYVQAIWDAVAALGFDGGRVLEPGCGSGNFLGFAPPGARLTGIEVDPTTAAIAHALYPDAEIRAESFADTRLPVPGLDSGFDLVVGNVPFGSHKLHDPRYNPGREHPIHNHFVLKSLHATRPGGLVALITSRYTMDGVDAAHQRAREQMAGLADLVGAVRLPDSAHQAAAGTDVVTDLLVFRRRAGEQATTAGLEWLRVRPVELPVARGSVTADTFEVNEYFLAHPDMVLGEQVTDSGRHGPVLTVRATDPDTPAALQAALRRLAPTPQVVLSAPEPQTQEGLFIDEGDGRFSQIRDGRRVRHEPARNQIAELRALIGLRETVLALLDEEATHRDDTPRMAALRIQLNTRYDTYARRFGAINRFGRSTGTRIDKKTGEVVETERRINPRLGGFRDDPFFPYVSALEKFDDETGRADKAEVFTQRVITMPTPVRRVDTPDDALVVCWDRHNEVRLDVVASLLGLHDPRQALQALGDLVFEDPDSGELIRRAEYLSGNVRRKLASAHRAADADPRFSDNVGALQSVVPRDLTPAEISARLGSPWITAALVQQFLREILEDDSVHVSNIGARWSVTGGEKKGVLATTVWGTAARSATDLAANLLNSHTIEITTTVGAGAQKRTVRDIEATAFAQAKAQQLDERFRAWLWEDPDRATELGRTYNDRFNARVPRTYEGEHVDAPGLSAAFRLHPHQMAAVARIRNTPGVGLFHGTGAGKTLEMIVGGMELVRLGLVTKPCYVVPKGVLGQFRREFLQAYPRAKVLAADSEDLTGDRRRQFVARCSTGDWDAILISHTAFKKIPVSRDVRVAYLNKQLERLRTHLANSEGADRYTVKDIEKQVSTLKEQIAEQLATPSDPGVEFERTGIGYLFIDEAHVYKNLRVISSIPELAHDGNQITADLDMKLEYLRRTSRRVVTLATATPIDNSPSEILTMTKYAAPELLADMGIEEDDQYHAAFIQPRRRVEMRPDGSGFASRTRHSRYVNLPEQKQLMYTWADVKLKEHLDLGEPAIIGGQPEVLAVPASPELHERLVTLASRAKQVTSGHPESRLNSKGELKDDNILWISTDGRTASLDLRLVGDHTNEPQKIDVAADRIAEIWREHRDDIYYRPDGTPEPVRGSLQLVFCDLGVPRRDRWSVYEGLRDELVARSMPAEKIRFAQDAKDRRQKDQLDADARDGAISVLIGSRQGLGTGRNIQRRVVSVLQLDPTWKLTPVTQSLGRGQRQGNDNPAIHHIFVVTEGSYDPFLWQKVDDKARFTRQMLDPNDTTTRIIDAQDDDNAGQIDPAVMFAVAAGRPELLELHRTEETVGALRLEARIWGDEQFTLKATVAQNQRSITGLRHQITDLDRVLARRRDTRGDAFVMTLDGTSVASRADAGTALVRRLRAAVHADRGRHQLDLGELGGIALSADIEPGLFGDRALLRLDGIPDSMIELTQHDLDTLASGSSQDKVGLIRKLENRLVGADDLRQRYLDSIDRLQANIDRATTRIGLPFPQQANLDHYTEQLATLHKRLQILDTASPGQTPDGAAAEASAQGGTPDHGTRSINPGTTTSKSRPTAPAVETTRPSLDDADHATASSPRTALTSAAETVPPEVPAVAAVPAEPDQAPSTAVPETGTAVQQVLSQAGLPADQQRWLNAQLSRLTAEPHTRMIARTNDYDRARPVLDDKLDEVLADASDIDGMDLAARYFDDIGSFREHFRAAASIELYQRARIVAEAATSHDQDGPPGTSSEPAPQDHDHASYPDGDRPIRHHDVSAPTLPENQRRRRGHPFYPPADILAKIPPLYGTDRQPAEDKTLYLHYFGGAHDIWLAEYDPATGDGFGYVNLGNPDNAEWGYVSLPELEKISHGLVIIERDLYWTPVPAGHANLPGERAPRSAPAVPSPAAPATNSAPATPVIPDADGRTDRDAGTETQPPESSPARPSEPPTPKPSELTPRQRAAVDELAKERGAPWSMGREWRMRVFAQMSADDLAGLPDDVRQALTAELQESLTSPAWRERATARRLLGRWSGNHTALTEAQDRAVEAVCMPTSSYDLPDAARLGHYGRLTAKEYLALDPGYQKDIKADLKAIADSGATKTIPRNRSGIGATVRTTADHVVDAQNLLRHLGSELKPRPHHSNGASVGRTVMGLKLNPGDQVQLRKRPVTVDRIGIDLKVHLTDGGTLPDSTRRYRLIAASPDPTTDPATADGSASENSAKDAVSNASTPAAPVTPTGAAPSDAATTAAPQHEGPRSTEQTQTAETAPTQTPPAATPPHRGSDAGNHADTNAAELSAEQRLLDKVAARVPADVVQWPDTLDGHPIVQLAFVANGTYGEVAGVDLQRQPITARGYVIEAQGLRGGYGGWHPGTAMVVELGDLPDGPVVYTVQTEMDARLTVLDPPRPDMPAGEAAPWLRMPVEQQILAARTGLGLAVEVRDGPANELWTVQGCPEQLTGKVASWLFGGRYASWHGRARPEFRPELVREAIVAGRIPAEQQPTPAPDVAPPPDSDLEAHRHNGSLVPMAASAVAPPTWLAGLVLNAETATADGQHHVRRRTNGHRTSVYVEARHPQLGMLPRGRIALTARPEGENPARWQITDPDATPVGEHAGAYVEAESQLLAATAALDEPLTDQELSELTADDDTDTYPDANLNNDGDARAAIPGRPTTDTPATAPRPRPAVANDASASQPPGVATPAGADAEASEQATPSWSDRIHIDDGPSLIVRGTTGAPREEGLRGLLKQYRFRYQRATGEWRYTGRPTDRAAAIGDIRRWLTTQDRADTARAHKPPAVLPPTEQQQRIIDVYQAGRTIAVQALAGTGKTSTLQMLATARPQTRIAYIAFNRPIANEAQRKFGRNVRADTSHAFAREALTSTPLRGKLARVGHGARWPEEWADHLHITVEETQPVSAESVARMVIATVRAFRESAADTIGHQHLPEALPNDVPGLAEAVLDYARAAWQDIADPDGQLLFDHDDYLKLWALDNPRLPYDVIFFDEAQDINDVLRKVIQDQPAQTIVVGDSNQSIYGFRGAIDALKHWPAQVTLPLTQSWRFGPAIADTGNHFLRLLNSPWLLTGNQSLDGGIGPVDDPDAVLARTNAGAVAAVFDAFDDGKRVALMGGGRAIEEIAKAAKDLQAGHGTKHPDLSRFTDWDDVRAYVEDGEDAQSLRAFVRLVDRRGADGLLHMVKELVNEEQTDLGGNPTYDVIVSTVHKAKGREWGQVRIADDFPQPQENLTTGKWVLPNDEQLRLAYVAVTRARYRLELGSLAWIEDFADASSRPSAATTTAPRPSAAERSSAPVALPAADQPSSHQPAQEFNNGAHSASAGLAVELPAGKSAVDGTAVTVEDPSPGVEGADHEGTRRLPGGTVEELRGPLPAPAADHDAPDIAANVEPSIAAWLSAHPFTADVPAEQRQWLAQQVAEAANNDRVRLAALANDEENFEHVFAPTLADHLVDAADADLNNPAGLLFFLDKDFAQALNTYARHAVYLAVSNRPAPTASGPDLIPDRPAAPQADQGAADHVQAVPPRPPTPRNPAQLARLDSAPETSNGPVSLAGRTSRLAGQVGATRRSPIM